MSILRTQGNMAWFFSVLSHQHHSLQSFLCPVWADHPQRAPQTIGIGDCDLMRNPGTMSLQCSYDSRRDSATMAMRQYDDDQTDDIMIHLVPELRQRIKLAAAQSNVSAQEYIERILEQTVPPEANSAQIRTGRLNRAAVDELLRFREELRRAHPGQVFEDSPELIHQAREERTRELEQR